MITKKIYHLEISYFSDVGAKRRQNQDNFYVQGNINWYSTSSMRGDIDFGTENLNVVALFDGMGGGTSGEKASLCAAECVKLLEDNLHDEIGNDMLENAVSQYHKEFLERLNDYLEDEYCVCGTTCVAMIVKGQRMIPVWLGDSRMYLLRNGVLSRLTKDHSVAQRQIDKGVLTEEDAKSTIAWHTLTGYMGMEEARFSIGESVQLYSGDCLLLCSDGISDLYSDEMLKEILSKGSQNSINEFENVAKTKATDNCTAILIEVLERSGHDVLEKGIERAKEWLQSKLKGRK